MTARPLDVFVGVASIPSRESSLRTVMERLLPQARQVGVYLNGYEEVPDFLRHDRIVVARSQDHGDLRDNGKFFFLEESAARYYATVDDDILYPVDYLEQLIGGLNDAEQGAAVGVHGAIYPTPIIDLIRARHLFHFKDFLPYAMPVHLLGTGTTLFDQSDWQLRLSEFGSPGMADVWFASAASKRSARLFVVRRQRGWLEPIEQTTKSRPDGALFHEANVDSSEQLATLKQAAVSAGTLGDLVSSLLSSDRFTEDFTVLQAVDLDRIRKQLGWEPLSDDAADRVRARLRDQRAHWSEDRALTEGDIAALGELIADILAQSVSARSLTPVLELLDRLRALAESDTHYWNTLPYAARLDSRENRLEYLRVRLLESGVQRSEADAKALWSAFRNRAEVSPDVALQVERASVRTQFERLPAFAALVAKNPLSAALLLYEYFEIHSWSRQPDITALRLVFGSSFDSPDLQLLLCMVAARSGSQALAKRILDDLRRRSPWDVDVRLMDASLRIGSTSTLRDALIPVFDVLDEAVMSQDLMPYKDLIREDGEPEHWIHLMGRVSPSRPTLKSGAARVSVLMTTYNDATTIASAMASVLAAESVDLQLVVVEDASTDDTLEVVKSIEDPRVMVIRNDENVGPYVSRNRGLEIASGDYIAIADADDWSHPQRLHFQSSILGDAPYVQACKVAHVRVQPNGRVDLENHLRFVGDGPMSLMFRKMLIDHIGGFDHVRTRGDIEYIRRIGARFGPGAVASFGIPLVLSTSTSVSNSKLFAKESLNQYRNAARQWHERNSGSDALYVPLSGSRAPFLAPHELVVQPSMVRVA